MRVSGKPRRRLGEVELPRPGGGAVIAGRDDPNGCATGLTAANDMLGRGVHERQFGVAHLVGLDHERHAALRVRSGKGFPMYLCDTGSATTPNPRHWAWADLMRRAFDIDVLACPRCGGRLRLIATLEDPGAIRAILAAVASSEERADRAPPCTRR